MKTLKKWALRAWRVVLWLPWIASRILFLLSGGLLALIYCIAGQDHYAERLFDNLLDNW